MQPTSHSFEKKRTIIILISFLQQFYFSYITVDYMKVVYVHFIWIKIWRYTVGVFIMHKKIQFKMCVSLSLMDVAHPVKNRQIISDFDRFLIQYFSIKIRVIIAYSLLKSTTIIWFLIKIHLPNSSLILISIKTYIILIKNSIWFRCWFSIEESYWVGKKFFAFFFKFYYVSL